MICKTCGEEYMKRDERTAPAPASPMQMNNDPEWLRKKAEAEDGCDVAVGDPATVECAWCHGTLLRKQPEQPPVTVQELLCRIHPERVRAIAAWCSENNRSDFAFNLIEVADYLERRQ